MSDIGAQENPRFKGHTPGGISCEDFVRTVRTHAVFKERSRDNEYIADYAMSCLTDDALHWSETLSDEIQGDWSLLRRALLAEYGSSTRRSGIVVAELPAAIVPVPAAAPANQPIVIAPPPPAPPQGLRGRIRVFAEDYSGYLSKHVDEGYDFFKWICLTNTNIFDACVVSGEVADGGLRFKFENLADQLLHLGNSLGMVWIAAGDADNTAGYAALTVVDVRGLRVTSKKSLTWIGPVSWLTWDRAPDNTLTPRLEGMPDSGVVVSAASFVAPGGRRLEIVGNVENFVTVGAWSKARLVFEPM